MVKMTFQFALDVMTFSEKLMEQKKILFAKGAEETEYWLELCEMGKNYLKPEELLADIESIFKSIEQNYFNIKSKGEIGQLDIG